jgi:branched-chain amino acid transport system permease protein
MGERYTCDANYRRDMIGLAAFAVALVVMGLLFKKNYHFGLITDSCIFAIGALGMFLLFGLCGQISVGQAAFFGIGAYTSALLVMSAGVPPLVAVVASVALSSLVGWFISRPILRLTTNYLAMATLAFGVIVFVLFSQAVAITGGLDPGIFGVPPMSLFGMPLKSAPAKYWMVGTFTFLALLLVINLIHSRAGRAFVALKGSEVATSGLGVDVVHYKVVAFTVAAGLAGLAGSLFAFVQGSFNAANFTVGLSIELLVMVVVGSLASPWGALFGAFFITLIPTFLEDFEVYKLLIYGTIILIVTVLMPDGLARAAYDGVRALASRTGRQ